MQKTVEAGDDLAERTEIHAPRNGPDIVFTYLSFGGDRLDAGNGFLRCGAIRCRDENRSVIRNVDLSTCLFCKGPDHRTTLSDNIADLVRMYFEGDNSRRILR